MHDAIVPALPDSRAGNGIKVEGLVTASHVPVIGFAPPWKYGPVIKKKEKSNFQWKVSAT